tara:strand:+ start:5468 stop:5695 length:228 start_codon:yes stop_codon:yes gene_type:complete
MTKDMTYLAKQILPAMIEDGIVDTYLNASESKRIDILDLYVEAWNKKSEQFKELFFTDTKFRTDVIKSTWDILKK